jgi:hypothetical protein
MNFTDSNGVQHFLDDEVTSDIKKMEDFDRNFSRRAKELMESSGKSVFYCLKLCKNDKFLQGNYFLIPIEEADKEKIIQLYGDKFYIGIIHKPLK